jgi:hypothetical protein
MTTVKITIDDSLSVSKLKTALSLFHGVTKIEVEDTYVETENREGADEPVLPDFLDSEVDAIM